MASSTVDAEVGGIGGRVTIQGFRQGAGGNSEVFIGITENGDGLFKETLTLTPENAHILSEEIRKHAEFSLQQAEEQGEK